MPILVLRSCSSSPPPFQRPSFSLEPTTDGSRWRPLSRSAIFPIPLQMLNQTPNSRQKNQLCQGGIPTDGKRPLPRRRDVTRERTPVEAGADHVPKAADDPDARRRSINDAHEAGAAMAAGLVPRPLALRKNRTPLPSPWAPSLGSTHWHQRALFHMALRKPREPSLVSER